MTVMSKLGDRIKKAGRAVSAPAPIGFHVTAEQTSEPTMLAVARVPDAGKIADAVEKGADAVIVEKADANKIQRGAGKAPGAAVGVPIDSGGIRDAKELKEAGVDFVLLDLDGTQADALLEEKIGFVLPVTLDADEMDLRLLGDLPLDALLVPAPEGKLTLRNAMKLRRVAGLARTPLLMPADPGIGSAELQALRASGVVGIVVDGSSVGKLDKLRETIGKLRPRGRHREETHEVSIPSGGGGGDEDDWDDDDY